MRRLKRSGPAVLLALAIAVPSAASCGGQTAASPSATLERPALKVTTAHFQILGDRAGPSLLQTIADTLEANYPRITSDLRVSGLETTSVYVWQDSTSFYDHMRRTAGTVWQGSGGWVPGPHTVSVLASGLTASRAASGAVHEFAHVVSIAVNASIGNNPRWLWETVAVYENHEFVDPSTLDYMRAGNYPSLSDLDADFNSGRQVYRVGFLLGEYIVQRWGLDGLVRLIQRNGDVVAALGVATAEFESGWHTFLHQKYGLPAG